MFDFNLVEFNGQNYDNSWEFIEGFLTTFNEILTLKNTLVCYPDGKKWL